MMSASGQRERSSENRHPPASAAHAVGRACRGWERTLLADPGEGEDVEGALVDLTHAEVRVVRRCTRVGAALVVVVHTDRLGEGNVGVATKVLDQEAAADERGGANDGEDRVDLRCNRRW